MALIYVPLKINELYLFIRFVAIWGCAYEVPLQAFCPYFLGLSFSSRFVGVLNSTPLSDVYIMNIFYESLVYFFTLLIVSFDEKNFLIKSN